MPLQLLALALELYPLAVLVVLLLVEVDLEEQVLMVVGREEEELVAVVYQVMMEADTGAVAVQEEVEGVGEVDEVMAAAVVLQGVEVSVLC